MAAPSSTSPLTASPKVRSLLKRLHAQSSIQEAAIDPELWQAIRRRFPTDEAGAATDLDRLMLDKFIALDEDKCLFIYNLLLATGSTTVVEIGTSFGVSTIYLALAVARNVAQQEKEGGMGVVIGTEKEKEKAAVARSYWDEAGPEVEKWIDLREGDLRETLNSDLGLEGRKVDFLLLDIWPYVALPALNLVLPKLRRGAVVVTDNSSSSAAGYAELLQTLRQPEGPFRSVTLPFTGGLEMSVYDP